MRDYSKGNRQKVALIAALAVDAELLVLDEPTSGLDPLMEEAFYEVVRERRDEGATVLLRSHILAEVETLADRVSIIRSGRTVTTGSLADLRRHTRTNVHAVTARTPELGSQRPGRRRAWPGEHDGQVDVRFSAEPHVLGEVVGRLHAAGVETLTVTPAEPGRAVPRRLRGGAA